MSESTETATQTGKSQMTRAIHVNLPVASLKSAMAFYEALGFENKAQWTDETAACMMCSEAIFVMLLTHDKWRSFTSRPIPPSNSSEVLLCLSCDSRDEVDKLNEIAAKNGGVADIIPQQDYGFMYIRSIADPDGHVWEMMWMNTAAMPSQ
jgi:predicted lactoylglutathione lyase